MVTFTFRSCNVVLEEFPQEEREPVSVKEGQGAVLLCAPPKAWPGTCTRQPLACHLDVRGSQLLPSRVAEEVTYRWIYNEFPLFLHTDRRRFVSQKTGNLYISKVEAQDAGNYSCFVSSPVIGKSVFSKFIPLIPLPPDEGQSEEAPLLKLDCVCFLSTIFDVSYLLALRREEIPSRHQGQISRNHCHAGL